MSTALLSPVLAAATQAKGAGNADVGQAFLNAFPFMGNNSGLVLQKVGEHLSLSFAAVGIAVALTIPLGLWLGHIHKGSFLAITVANIGRALPSLAVLSALLALLGIGFVNVMVALIILAIPPILTNTYVAVEQVDRDTVDAANGMGMRPLEVLARVELPLALPLIFAGIRTSVVFVIASATLAGFFGGGTLGDIIVNQASYGLSGVLAGAILVALLALTFEVLFAALQRVVTPRGLRAGRAGAPAAVEEGDIEAAPA